METLKMKVEVEFWLGYSWTKKKLSCVGRENLLASNARISKSKLIKWLCVDWVGWCYPQVSYNLFLSRFEMYIFQRGVKIFRARRGFSTGTVRGNVSVIFAYIQTSFPHHVFAIRFGSPGNKYVLLIVSGQPIKEQWSWKYRVGHDEGVDGKNVYRNYALD